MRKRSPEKSARVRQMCTDAVLKLFQPLSIVTERFLSQKWCLQPRALSPEQELVIKVVAQELKIRGRIKSEENFCRG